MAKEWAETKQNLDWRKLTKHRPEWRSRETQLEDTEPSRERPQLTEGDNADELATGRRAHRV